MVGCVGCRCVRDGRARANPVQLLVVPLTLFILSFFLFLVYRLRYCRLMIRLLLPLFFHVISFPSTCTLFLVVSRWSLLLYMYSYDEIYGLWCFQSGRPDNNDCAPLLRASTTRRSLLTAEKTTRVFLPELLEGNGARQQRNFWKENKVKEIKWEIYTNVLYIYAVRLQLSLRVFFSSSLFSRVIWSANAPHANEPLICDQQHPHYKGDIYIYAHTPFFLLENV